MKKKKHLKIFAASSLAFFMGIGTLCGVLIAPGNVKATSSAELEQQAGQNANGAATATSEAIQLDPETDETIFTTESGIEIKSHNVSATGTATSIQYFTLGSYNGTAVKWLIVGASSAGVVSESSTPAGAAIVADQSKQKLVTGATSSSLAVNQILCVSQYAFNQATYNPNFVKRSNFEINFTESNAVLETFCSTTDQWTDYYSSYTAIPAHVANSLTLGTTLGINGYYGSGSGKIVKNSTFSSNYVFSLSSSHYTTFVGATNYKVPYLFTATSTATNIWASNSVVSGTVTSYFTDNSYKTGGSLYRQAQGSGAAYVNLNYISSSGSVTNIRLADFTASVVDDYGLGYYYVIQTLNNDYGYYFDFITGYTITNTKTISMAYRPAFILQL